MKWALLPRNGLSRADWSRRDLSTHRYWRSSDGMQGRSDAPKAAGALQNRSVSRVVGWTEAAQLVQCNPFAGTGRFPRGVQDLGHHQIHAERGQPDWLNVTAHNGRQVGERISLRAR